MQKFVFLATWGADPQHLQKIEQELVWSFDELG